MRDELNRRIQARWGRTPTPQEQLDALDMEIRAWLERSESRDRVHLYSWLVLAALLAASLLGHAP